MPNNTRKQPELTPQARRRRTPGTLYERSRRHLPKFLLLIASFVLLLTAILYADFLRDAMVRLRNNLEVQVGSCHPAEAPLPPQARLRS